VDREAFKKSLGISGLRKIIVAGSTHGGEEQMLLEAYNLARKEKAGLLLIIAPRHPDRAGEVEKICLNLGLSVMRKTRGVREHPWDVLILDTIGELSRFYALADLTFVGGSLVPHGGQNFMEPAFYEKPVLCGPHLENFAVLAEAFISSGAVRVVRGRDELAEAFRMKDEPALQEMGRRAKILLNSYQGATQRTLQAIETLMDEDKVGK
jgi:3-deoxy-D-manno-octulosonic-acid transferase